MSSFVVAGGWALLVLVSSADAMAQSPLEPNTGADASLRGAATVADAAPADGDGVALVVCHNPTQDADVLRSFLTDNDMQTYHTVDLEQADAAAPHVHHAVNVFDSTGVAALTAALGGTLISKLVFMACPLNLNTKQAAIDLRDLLQDGAKVFTVNLLNRLKACPHPIVCPGLPPWSGSSAIDEAKQQNAAIIAAASPEGDAGSQQLAIALLGAPRGGATAKLKVQGKDELDHKRAESQQQIKAHMQKWKALGPLSAEQKKEKAEELRPLRETMRTLMTAPKTVPCTVGISRREGGVPVPIAVHNDVSPAVATLVNSVGHCTVLEDIWNLAAPNVPMGLSYGGFKVIGATFTSQRLVPGGPMGAHIVQGPYVGITVQKV